MKLFTITAISVTVIGLCFWTDIVIMRFILVIAGFAFLYFTECFGFNSDMKGRMMSVLESRFDTDVVRDESLDFTNPDVELNLYVRTGDVSILNVHDVVLDFLQTEGYTSNEPPIESTSSTIIFLTKKDDVELCVLISKCVSPDDEYQIRIGLST